MLAWRFGRTSLRLVRRIYLNKSFLLLFFKKDASSFALAFTYRLSAKILNHSSKAAIAAPFGLPKPLAASQPAVASKSPLLPLVTSLRTEGLP